MRQLEQIEFMKFLSDFIVFTSLVQGEAHARRVRVAMFWSVISMLYACRVLVVESPEASIGVMGLSFRDLMEGEVFWFLFVLTSWYAVRFFFSAVKVFIAANPLGGNLFSLWRNFRAFKEREISNAVREIRAHMDDMFSGMDMNPSTQVFLRFIETVGVEKFFGALYYDVRHPLLGILENVIALLLLPAALCVLAWAALLGEFCILGFLFENPPVSSEVNDV